MSRTILVTGANGNLGREVVRYLASEGHKVIALTGTQPMPDNLAESIVAQKMVDLSQEVEAGEAIEEMIAQYPKMDAAILLAGGFEMGNMKATDEILLDKLISLNFKTAWFVIQPLMAHFKKHGSGQFILMGAKPAITPAESVNKIAYGVSKSMLFTLAEIINADGKEAGITASVIVPEVIDTPQNRKDMPDADFSTWVKPSTIADMIGFILSDAGKRLRQPVFKAYNQVKKSK